MNISIEPLLKFRLDRFPRATVLCDLDGTLVETDFANCLSYRQAILEVTNGVSTLEIRPGRRFVRTDLQVDFPELNDDQCRRIVALKEQYFESFLGATELNIKLAEAIKELSKSFGIVLVTNCRRKRATATLQFHGIFKIFSRMICAEELVTHGMTNKYESAIMQLGIESSEALVFEAGASDADNAVVAGVPRSNIFNI